MDAITQVLDAIEHGDPHAAEQLLPLVYDELRKLAAQRMAQEAPGQTLQATALVHEAYLRLVDGGKKADKETRRQGDKEREKPSLPVSQSPCLSVSGAPAWDSRGHFFAAAAEAMRRILVERARHKKSLKAGGAGQRVELADVEPAIAQSDDELLALHEALDKLEAHDKRKAELVKLRFFAGLTNEQAAQALGISSSTADNDWAYARSWLRLEIRGEGARP